MRNSIIKILSLICLVTFGACENESKIAINDPDRLFRPINLTSEINGSNVKLQWTPIKGSNYLVYIKRLNTSDSTSYEVVGDNKIVFQTLYSSTIYVTGIKSVSIDKKQKDSDYQTTQFTTGVENIFFAPAPTDIGENSLLLSWDATKEVTSLTVSEGTTLVGRYELTKEHTEEGKISVDQLLPNKSYTVRIYKGDMLRGSLTLTTTAK